MNPLIAATILEVLKLGTDLWRRHAGKPEGWEPSDADWDELQGMAGKTAEQYKAEATALAANQRENE